MLPGDDVWAFVWDDTHGKRMLKQGEYICRREHEGCVPAVDFKVVVDGAIVIVLTIYVTEAAAKEGEDWT
jgi:hypothetical protein